MRKMNTYFIFSDECGNYNKVRSKNFIKNHPYYVRSNVIITDENYQIFEKAVVQLNRKFMFKEYGEVKWSFIGDIFNKRPPEGFEEVTLEILKSYISEFIQLALNAAVSLIFTITDNSKSTKLEDSTLIKWHVQNALQRIQMNLEKNDGYGVFILDDLSDKNKQVNKTIYNQMCQGDFVNYGNLKKSILIDYSHQCVGLQLADFTAGILTNSLRRIQASGQGYQFAWDLFTKLQFNIRDSSVGSWAGSPWVTARYGILSIPSDNCIALINSVSDIVERIRLDDLFKDDRKI